MWFVEDLRMLKIWLLLLTGLVAVATATLEKPGPPAGLQARVLSPKKALVSWRPPTSGGRLTGYKLEYVSRTIGVDHSGEQTPSSASRLFVLFALEEDTVYNITLSAVNDLGDGPSISTTVKTHPSNPTSPAGSLTATKVTKTSITVNWTPPPVREQNGRLTGYVLQEVARVDSATPLSIPVGVDTLIWTFTGLQPFTSYAIKVAAVNSEGVGPFGVGITVRTLEDVPDQPSIAGVAVLFNSMAVLARAPATEKGERRGWEISYTVDGVETLQRSSPHTPLIFLQSISLGKVYRLKLRSHNTAGLGAWSEVWEQTAAPIIDNITTVASGCGVRVCYNIHTPNTPTTLQEFRIHRSLCGKMSEIDMVSYPITKDHCVLMKNLQPETCYSLRYEGRVRIGEMGVPSDMSTAMQVKTEQCEEPDDPNHTQPPTTKPTNESCRLEKMQIGGFFSGYKDVPYFCIPMWVVNRCQMIAPTAGRSCVPMRSKLSPVPFKCTSMGGAKRRRVNLKVAKDLKCATVVTDQN